MDGFDLDAPQPACVNAGGKERREADLVAVGCVAWDVPIAGRPLVGGGCFGVEMVVITLVSSEVAAMAMPLEGTEELLSTRVRTKGLLSTRVHGHKRLSAPCTKSTTHASALLRIWHRTPRG